MQNEEKLQKLLSLMDSDGLTEAKFLAHFKRVLEFVKKNKERIDSSLKRMEALHLRLMAKVEDTQKASNIKIDSKLQSELDALTNKFNGLKSNIDSKLAEVKDGENADEDVIVEKVLSLIEIPEVEDIENNIPKLGTQIRDALELLQGKERLDYKAIDGLEETLKEIKKEIDNRPMGGGGGGFSKIHMESHFVDDELPTGDVDGVNTDFVMAKAPNPLSSLKVYKDGQRMSLTEDYTVVGKTLTFLTAPLLNSIIKIDYRF